MKLYEAITEANIPHDNVGSDLLVPSTPQTLALIKRSPEADEVRPFARGRETWLCVSGAYLPFFDNEPHHAAHVDAQVTPRENALTDMRAYRRALKLGIRMHRVRKNTTP